MTSVKIFCSYSHADDTLRKKLDEHLGFLRREGVTTWHDRRLLAGEKFDEVIDKEIIESDIILLLVSASFINSDYCYNIELEKAIERHEKNEAIVVPVLLSECIWDRAPFAKIVMANEDAKPIDNAKYWTLNEALSRTALSISKVVDEVRARKNRTNAISFKSDENQKIVLDSSFEAEDSDTIQKAIEVFKQTFKKLDYKSSSEEFNEVEQLKRKIISELITPFDDKLMNVPALRNKMPQILFERIYALESLDRQVIDEIQKTRYDKSMYTWYERKVIINAISLSLINSKKFDQRKSDLLLDFLTDFEEGVWESALTGLILSLLHHKNKWDRFGDLKKRLGTLKELPEVQDGLTSIDFVLRLKLYESEDVNEGVYNLDFFKSPLNYFLPFFPNNPILENALDNCSGDLEPEFFENYVTNLPLLDCYKYALCLSVEDGGVRVKRISGKESEEFRRKMTLASYLFPYKNILSEYFNYFKYYPKSDIQNIFDSQMSISKTKLKDVVLDNVHQLEMVGDMQMEESKYRAAINNFIDLLKIVPDHYRCNWKLAVCYLSLEQPEPHNGLKHLLVLEGINANDVKVICKIARCYELLKKEEECLSYIRKALHESPFDKDVLLQATRVLPEMDMLHDAIEFLVKGIVVKKNDYDLLVRLARLYIKDNDFSLALDAAKKALTVSDKEENSVLYDLLASCYLHLYEFDEAIKYAKINIENDKKDWLNNMALGRAYLLSGIDIQQARKYLEKSISKKGHDVGYGNLGHLELVSAHRDKAVEYYVMSLKLFKDEKEFRRRMKVDAPLMSKLGISMQEYEKIIEDVVCIFKQ